MSINTLNIQHGMEVFSSDGQKIGSVGAVYNSGNVGTESGAQATSTVEEESATNPDGGGFGFLGNLVSGGPEGGAQGTDFTRDPVEVREEYGGAAPSTATTSDGGYFEMSEGGFLGVGASHLYIPFSAVETVAADGVVTLSVSKDDAAERFKRQPAEVGNSNS